MGGGYFTGFSTRCVSSGPAPELKKKWSFVVFVRVEEGGGGGSTPPCLIFVLSYVQCTCSFARSKTDAPVVFVGKTVGTRLCCAVGIRFLLSRGVASTEFGNGFLNQLWVDESFTFSVVFAIWINSPQFESGLNESFKGLVTGGGGGVLVCRSRP